MSAKKIIEKISARVFCHGTGGGNPVTVFASHQPLLPALQQQLAKQCDWESVMVACNDADTISPELLSGNEDDAEKPTPQSTRSPPEMAFYMPSGQEVNFCAHAALGGAYAVSDVQEFSFITQMGKDVNMVSFPEDESGGDDDVACLFMRTKFEESSITHLPSLQRLLREHLGIAASSLTQTYKQPPTLVNSSIARPKTLVFLNSLAALREAKAPIIKEGKLKSWSSACGSIDGSTGMYCYAYRDDEENAWECRQFPQSSGYPEDPATGIAAAALAASMFSQGSRLGNYRFYQGMSMDKPSLIEVKEMEITRDNVAFFGLQGRVEIDDRENIEIEE